MPLPISITPSLKPVMQLTITGDDKVLQDSLRRVSSKPPNKVIDAHYQKYLKQKAVISERKENFEEYIDI